MAMNQTKNYEIPTEMRDFAHKSVEQARKAIGGFMGAAHKAMETLEGSTNSIQTSATDATRKSLSFAEQNMAATFDYAQKLVRARDFQEAMAIQTEFARSQFAAMQTQMKELGEMAQAVARTATTHVATAASHATTAARAAAEQASSTAHQAANQMADAVRHD